MTPTRAVFHIGSSELLCAWQNTEQIYRRSVGQFNRIVFANQCEACFRTLVQLHMGGE